MSHKQTLDKQKPSFPLTARQKRMTASNRKTRKMDRKTLRYNADKKPRKVS